MELEKLPIIGRRIEINRAKKEAEKILAKYPLYKTEAAMRQTIANNKAKYERKQAKLVKIKLFFSYVFLMPLSKIFKIISFLSRIVLTASIFTFFYGGYELYKFAILHSDMVNVQRMIILLLAPFISAFFSYAFGMLAVKCWDC